MLFTAILAFSLLAGCGDKKETEETKDANTKVETTEDTAETVSDNTASTAPAVNVTLKDYDVLSLVTLGEYKGLEATVAEAKVEDATKEQYVNQIFSDGITEEVGEKTRPVENGDTVFLSFEGKQDGVAFSGGSSEGTLLEVGSGSFIPGFEEGLVGLMPGEDKDLELTFPEVYDNNPDLAGTDVVFTVNVKYIVPEMSDEVIANMKNENFSNIEELNQYVYDNLLLEAQNTYDMEVENALIQKLIENTTFTEVPADLIAKYTNNVMTNMSTTAATYGYDADTYASMLYGADAATVSAKFGEDSAKQGLTFQAIAETEKLTVSDEELDEKLQEYVTNYGLNSIEELIGETDKEDYRDFFMFEKVIAFIKENAVIKSE